MDPKPGQGSLDTELVEQSPEIAGTENIQGALFETHIATGGATDPELLSETATYEPQPDGFYPETTEQSSREDTEVSEQAKEAVKRTNRHRGQLGKHSPLERNGSYEDVQVGDYLPGFGPVTYTNFSDALLHAESLEKQRRSTLSGIAGQGSLMQDESPEQGSVVEVREPRVALVHVLAPEFHGLDPNDFADITDDLVGRASPAVLREALLDTDNTASSPLHGRDNKGKSVVSYRSGEQGLHVVWLSVTPTEYGLFSRHVDMLGRTAFNSTLASRDAKLRAETDNPAAKARTDEDVAAANRAAVRQVERKLPKMEAYLEEELESRIEVIQKFIEMTKHRNLSRGTYATVQARFEHLRQYVFGDMLDAVGNQKRWTEEHARRADQILQKRLYISGTKPDRVRNFMEMLELAEEYYGHKRAFVLTRIWETREYLRKNQDAVDDARQKDQERAGQDA